MDKNNVNKSGESFTKKLGDKLERAGEKISEKIPGLGGKVERLGDRIEHSEEKKPQNQ